jgi:hypothetical protein
MVDWVSFGLGVIPGVAAGAVTALFAYVKDKNLKRLDLDNQTKIKQLEFELEQKGKRQDRRVSDAETKKSILLNFRYALEIMITSYDYMEGVEPVIKIERTKREIDSLVGTQADLLGRNVYSEWMKFRGQMMNLYRKNRPEYDKQVKHLFGLLKDEYNRFGPEYKDITGRDIE